MSQNAGCRVYLRRTSVMFDLERKERRRRTEETTDKHWVGSDDDKVIRKGVAHPRKPSKRVARLPNAQGKGIQNV